MNIYLRWILLFSASLISFFAFSEDGNNLQKSAAGHISIVFTDTNVYRRTLDSAPAIGSGMEDYSIKIGCMGRSDCVAKIKSIFDLVSTKGRIVKSCKKPIYARITINVGSIAYGEEGQVDVYDIDYTGKCVNHLGSWGSRNFPPWITQTFCRACAVRVLLQNCLKFWLIFMAPNYIKPSL